MSQKGKENIENSEELNSKGGRCGSCKKRVTEKCKKLSSFKSKKTDPNGSYTGCPDNTGEVPVQDADDL